MGEQYKYDVFISFSKDDREAAELFAIQLIGHGLTVWIDYQNLTIGSKWDEEFGKAMSQSKLILILLGPANNRKRTYQSAEIELALSVSEKDKTIKLIPVFLPGYVHGVSGLPEQLKLIIGLDLKAGIVENPAIGKLVSDFFPELEVLMEDLKAYNILFEQQKFEEAAQLLDEISQHNHNRWNVFINVAAFEYLVGEFELAYKHFQKTIELNSYASIAYKGLGDIELNSHSKYASALKYYSRALDTFRKIQADENNLYVANILTSMGMAYINTFEMAKAEEMLARSKAIMDGLKDVPDIYKGQHNMCYGLLYFHKHEMGKSIVHLQSAKDIYAKVLGPDNSLTQQLTKALENIEK